MPESSAFTLKRTWMTPVTAPAIMPPAMPASVAGTGLQPSARSRAVMAAPSGNDPSAVMSGIW